MEHIEKLTSILIETQDELEKFKKLSKKWESKAFNLQDDNNQLRELIEKAKIVLFNKNPHSTK